MPTPPNPITLTRTSLSDIYATFLRKTDLNIKNIQDYLNVLRSYINEIPLEPTVTDEQIQTAILNSRKLRTIPYTLLNGGLHTFDDGVTVTRNDNTYTILETKNVEKMFVIVKKTLDKTVLNCSIQTISNTVKINVFSILDENIDVIYF